MAAISWTDVLGETHTVTDEVFVYAETRLNEWAVEYRPVGREPIADLLGYPLSKPLEEIVASLKRIHLTALVYGAYPRR